MVICFDASEQANAALEKLMATGRYRDLNAAISAAICNQAMLDSRVAAEGGIVVRSPDSPAKPGDRTEPTNVGSSPSLLLLPEAPYELATADAGMLSMDSAAVVGPKNWPWGQFNKLLPVKVTSRATLNLLLQNPEIGPHEAAEVIADVAVELGSRLRQADELSRRRRDEAFSSAFPATGKSQERSRQRFMEQFIFATGSFADRSFPLVLGLVRADCSRLRLTKAGKEFSELRNPLLDGNYLQSAEKFSPEELEFLRAHIKANVPAERSAQQSVLRAVHDGARNPDAIDAYLKQLFPAEATELTAPFLATQRTGVVSRAVELKFLRRERDGVRVLYHLLEAGSDFLKP